MIPLPEHLQDIYKYIGGRSFKIHKESVHLTRYTIFNEDNYEVIYADNTMGCNDWNDTPGVQIFRYDDTLLQYCHYVLGYKHHINSLIFSEVIYGDEPNQVVCGKVWKFGRLHSSRSQPSVRHFTNGSLESYEVWVKGEDQTQYFEGLEFDSEEYHFQWSMLFGTEEDD